MMNKMLKHVNVMLVILLAIPLLFACGGGGGSGGDDPVPGGDDTSDEIPEFVLSADQEKIISDYGIPAYLYIIVESEEGSRQEVWTYLGEVNNMYVFWDGERAKEESINVDPSLNSNPPYTDPALFTKNTKKSHIVELFGNDYTLVKDESFEDNEAWHYVNEGLIVSFQKESLIIAQTLDKP